MNPLSVRGAVYGITAAAIWGGMYVVSDIVLHTIPPFTLLTLRVLIGAIILGAIPIRQGRLALPRRDVIRLMSVGVLGFGISLGAQFVGTAKAGALNGAVVTTASPAFILLFAWLLLREPLNLTRIASVALASLGVLVVLDLSHFDASSQTFAGNLALTVAALTWGAYSVLIRRVSAHYSTIVISFYALVGGLLLAVPASALELTSQPVGQITVGVVAGVLYLGVISTALAMFLWNRAFALVEASVASLFFFAQPLVGVLLATALLHQPLTVNLIFGGVLIIGGVVLSMQRSPAAKSAEAAESLSQI